jgi:hypothetical protein
VRVEIQEEGEGGGYFSWVRSGNTLYCRRELVILVMVARSAEYCNENLGYLYQLINAKW